MKKTTLALLSLFAVAVIGTAASPCERDASRLPPAASKQDITYARDIKPILDKTCLDCHSGPKPKAQLRLDSLEHILKGGRPGKVVEPGKSAQSLLVYAVARNQAEAMPPKGKGDPLSREMVGLIRAWIDAGAR